MPLPWGCGRKPVAKTLVAAVSVDIFHLPLFYTRLQPAPVAGAANIGNDQQYIIKKLSSRTSSQIVNKRGPPINKKTGG
ncbi:hypothetical protein, partial [Enterobacter hormaechei]